MTVKYYKKIIGKKDKGYNLEIKKCEKEYHSTKGHYHNEWSLNLIEEGSTKVSTKNEEHGLEKGILSIIPPDMVHDCHPSSLDNWKFTLLYIDDKWLTDTFQLLLSKDKIFYVKLEDKKQENFLNLVGELTDTESSEKLEEVLIKLVNKFMFENFNVLTDQEIVEKEILNKIKEFVEKKYKKKLSLDELSDTFGISKYHLLRSFEELFGVTPLSMQKILRFNEAKNLLKQNIEIADIALELGYYDQSHFSKEFKSFSGVTPNKYKK